MLHLRHGNQVWDSDPDTYGVWRSSRTRKIPSRYTAENDSDSEYDGPGKSYKKYYHYLLLDCLHVLAVGITRDCSITMIITPYHFRNNFLMDSSEDSDDDRGRKSQWKKFGTPVRATSRKKEQIR